MTMAKYIERDRLIEDLTELAKYQTGERQQGILGVIETIRIRKAADVEPVRHGHWVVKQTALGKSYTICSNCEYDFVVEIDGHFSRLDLTGMPRCPECGAKMDEEVSE